MKAKKSAAANPKPIHSSKQMNADQKPMRQAMSMHSESFTDMLRDVLLAQPKLKRIFKLPPWLLFPVTYARKDQASLAELERERFLCAFNVLNGNGTLGKLVDIHGDASHQMHGTLRFLPWHRIYLLIFEQALRSIHPDVSIPYWDWTQPTEQSFPSWLASVTPTVVTPTRTIAVTRSPQSPASLAMIASNTPTIMADSTFSNFTFQLEGIVHNAVHGWVGGSMGSIPTAPADPIFWMHHCNIDRLWWQWQNTPQGTGKNPPLTGAAAVMDPWSYVEADTRDIAGLGYAYV
jgi:tyrosinase